MQQAWHRQFLWNLARRKAARLNEIWAGLTAPQRVRAFQLKVRANLWRQLGGVPERTDLAPVITGTIKTAGYRIDRVHFQSLPGFYVTANLYVPARLKGPAPGVLCPVGHHREAKAWPEYQVLFANLALRGFVVLAFDPLGQAERGPVYSYYYGDAHGNAHDVQGCQCQLTGRPLPFYFLWDTTRALDYLASRPEVDASRLGCTGSSGGGTQTTHLAAVDERVAAAAPVCNTGSHLDVFASWMLHPEGNFIDVFAPHGPSNENLSICAAPRPLLLVGGTEDHLSISGMLRVHERVRRVYGVLGHSENAEFAAVLEHHSYSRGMREAVYAFLTKHLRPNYDGPDKDQDIAPLSSKRLNVTRSGHVEELGSRSVHGLNLRLAQRQAKARAKRRPLDAEALLGAMRAVYQPDARLKISGRLVACEGLGLASTRPAISQTEGGSHRQLFLVADGALPLQSINLYESSRGSGGVVVYLRDASYAQHGALVRAAVESAEAVLSAELPSTDGQRLLMVGLTPVGYHWLVFRRILGALPRIAGGLRSDRPLHLIADGRVAGAVGLALAVEERARLASLTLINSYLSLLDTIASPRQDHAELQIAPGALEQFDLADAIAVLADVPVTVVNPWGRAGRVCTPGEARRLIRRTRGGARVRIIMEPPERLHAVVGAQVFANSG